MEKFIGRINSAFEFGRNLFEVGGLFGVTPGSVALLVVYLAGLGWAMIKDAVPLWGFMLAAPLGLIFILHLYTAIKKAWAVRGIQPISLEKVADACDRAVERYWNFVEAHKAQFAELEAVSTARYAYSTGREQSEALDVRRAVLEMTLTTKLSERVGGDLGAAAAMLNSVGVEVRVDMRSLHWANDMARKIASRGRLLRNGQLEAAKKMRAWD